VIKQLERLYLVEDDQITVGKADIDNVLGDLDIENNLTIGGELKAQKLHD
jgi:hypothetical protein